MRGAIEIGLLLPSRGPLARRAIESAVETLARSNEAYLRAHPKTPRLLQSGVRYKRERRPFGSSERWQTIPEIIREGSGDCEDLSAWAIAQLRVAGIRAYPHVVSGSQTKPGKWHIQIIAIINGRKVVYDPSRKLGM